ncbi:hypothetical protein FHX81_7630 [Saccharothrix saharensis]|uniref:Uncharacterized protein n=1 Tax=Saccharothrix saharensis TaxID=571190 RepID=A0A543JQP0_9PSEU|nr:hypothetical protein FHX81_7630 [Saccharothrix saharensis]
MDHPGSDVTVDVDVPRSGTYRLGVFHGTGGSVGRRALYPHRSTFRAVGRETRPGPRSPAGARHRGVPTSAVSTVQARAWSVSVMPRPGRSDRCIRPSRVSSRSSNSGCSQSKCSTHGSRG